PIGAFERQADCDRAAAGAEVGYPRARQFERPVDQPLRFGAWNQDRFVDLEHAAAELPLAEQVGQRPARAAPGHQLPETLDRSTRQRLVAMADQPGAVAAAGRFEQGAGLDSRQPAGEEQGVGAVDRPMPVFSRPGQGAWRAYRAAARIAPGCRSRYAGTG